MTIIQKNRMVITIMLLTFIAYNAVIYTQKCASSADKLTPKAQRGHMVWQNNNCASCHQLYGLGGYLGPDLTNVISAKGKGDSYVKAFVNTGYKSMPKFELEENEIDDLVQFLTEVDATGYSPNPEAKQKMSGWLELKYK